MHRFVCAIVLLAGLGQTKGSARYGFLVVDNRVFDDEECRELSGVGNEDMDYHAGNIGILRNSTCLITCVLRKINGADSEWNEDGTYKTAGLDKRLVKFEQELNAILDFDQSMKKRILKHHKNRNVMKKKCAARSENRSDINISHRKSKFCYESFMFEKCLYDSELADSFIHSYKSP